ncbi:hypothetical protein CTAYLR_001308 [Chrysophaeum taylorii]|uniref:Serine aminopeptidase S33 domain-containing protein n=1 Tax=Chrysophaeum taylorii TaxID=2483200 RepID=A0AAD7UCM8_9STRA|nr:hypothetical protein CTAYLR_001308 [Chrysophaeum taylorii]
MRRCVIAVVVVFVGRAFLLTGPAASRRRGPREVERKTQRDAVFERYDPSATGLPKLLIFPGIDGSAKVGVRNPARLLKEYFDVRVLRLGPDDRSTHEELVELAVREMDGSRCVLVGESMGGVTALGVALEHEDLVTAIVVANPATSYDRAPIRAVAPVLPLLPRPVYESLPALVTPLFGRPDWYEGLLEEKESTSSDKNIVSEVLRRSRALSGVLPPEALAWRERELVREGGAEVNALIERRRRSKQKPRWSGSAVFVAGTRDLVLPSVDECRRLVRVLGGRVVESRAAAHVILDELNLPQLLARTPGVSLRRRSNDSADADVDELLAPQSDIERLMRAAFRVVSPLFFSTNPATGRVSKGLEHVPVAGNRPVVLCGNHQLFGLDGPLIVAEFVKERRCVVPSLVYPPLLEETSPLDPLPYPLPGTAAMLRRFGCRPAGAREMLAALRESPRAVLVFPGGAREVFKRRGETYQLRWNDQTLARVAAKLNATLVPFSAVGGDEFFGDFLADSDEILRVPGIGDFFRNRTADLPSFVEDDVFVPPVLAPRLEGPRRQYFLFGTPIDTTHVDANNATEVSHLYGRLKAAVEDGLSRLLSARESDPYDRSAARRLAYETITNTQAPTFDLPLLDE